MPNSKVYRNLNKRDATWYSICHNGTRVTGYANEVCLSNVTMKHATPAQRERIQSCREVCQWLRGTICDAPEGVVWKRLLADPKKYNGFVDSTTLERVDNAAYVWLLDDGSAFYSTGE